MRPVSWAVTFLLSMSLLSILPLVPAAALADPADANGEAQFEKALSLVLAATAPRLTVEQRTEILKHYMQAASNKGLALQQIDGRPWRSTSHENASVTGERTLEGCQLWSGSPCALLLVNNDPEGSLVARDMPRLEYVGPFDVNQIPIIRADARARPEVLNYDRAPSPKAIAIHPWGQIFTASGAASPQAAQEAALAKCNSDPVRKGRDGPCFVYALNDNVIIYERRTSPK